MVPTTGPGEGWEVPAPTGWPSANSCSVVWQLGRGGCREGATPPFQLPHRLRVPGRQQGREYNPFSLMGSERGSEVSIQIVNSKARCGSNCVPPKHMLQSKPSAPVNVALFVSRVFADVISEDEVTFG